MWLQYELESCLLNHDSATFTYIFCASSQPEMKYDFPKSEGILDLKNVLTHINTNNNEDFLCMCFQSVFLREADKRFCCYRN